jgi:hypothetical protein
MGNFVFVIIISVVVILVGIIIGRKFLALQ